MHIATGGLSPSQQQRARRLLGKLVDPKRIPWLEMDFDVVPFSHEEMALMATYSFRRKPIREDRRVVEEEDFSESCWGLT